MKKTLACFFVLTASLVAKAQDGSKEFMHELHKHCHKAYQGKVVSSPVPSDFDNKELIMYVSSCEPDQIKVPFFVGDDLSRTWVFTLKDDKLELKHDHRKQDGTPDDVTMYGGTTSHSGSKEIQFFPADQYTNDMLPGAGANLWWVTLDGNTFSYNLKRVTSENVFNVVFDLSNPITTDKRPW